MTGIPALPQQTDSHSSKYEKRPVFAGVPAFYFWGKGRRRKREEEEKEEKEEKEKKGREDPENSLCLLLRHQPQRLLPGEGR